MLGPDLLGPVSRPDLTGARRCWPCAVANSAIGLLVAWLPFVATSLGESQQFVLWATAVWGIVVTGYTGYRLLALGYLPYAERVARWIGLHDRIGPGRKDDDP
jgi:hypothetical protein